MKARRIRQQQVGEERQPLRLHEDGAQLLSAAAAEVQRAQGAKPHPRGCFGGRLRWAVIRQVTLRERGNNEQSALLPFAHTICPVAGRGNRVLAPPI